MESLEPQIVKHVTFNNCDLYCGDCLSILPLISAQGIKAQMVFSDPPYGTTHCRWDSVIDLSMMWRAVQGVSYPNTPILIFGQQPFSSALGYSNIKNLRYSWIWEKAQPTGFLNSKRMPMKAHEEILVFYQKLPVYNPIKTSGHVKKVVLARHQEKCNQGDIYNSHQKFSDYISTERYPRSVIKFKTDKQTESLHSTQKPVALLEYLIKTYTNEDDLIIDFAMGSGSCAIACMNTNRRFLGIELDTEIFNIAVKRINNAIHP